MQVKITLAYLRGQRSWAIGNSQSLLLHDIELKGFGCYISSKGEVSWFVQRHIGGRGGKQIRTVIGHLSSMTIDEARKQAIIDLGKIAAGEDVSLRKKVRLAEQKKIVRAKTLGNLFDTYVTLRLKEYDNSDNRYWSEVKRYFYKDVAPIIDPKTPIINITKTDIRSLMQALEPKESARMTIFSFLRPFFKWIVENDHIESSPMADLSPPKPSKERDRVLCDEELAHFWFAADKIGFPYGKCFQLMLLTAQREDEVGGMQWIELDLESPHWEIPKERTKTENAHIVHLHSRALTILQNIPRRSEHVFFTRKSTKSKLGGYGKAKNMLDLLMSNPTMTLEEARARVNTLKTSYEHLITVKPWRLHDLRRTGATNMAKLKHPPHIVDKAMNHAIPSKVRRIYNRFEYLDERRAALEDWGNYIEKLVSEPKIIAQLSA